MLTTHLLFALDTLERGGNQDVTDSRGPTFNGSIKNCQGNTKSPRDYGPREIIRGKRGHRGCLSRRERGFQLRG